MFFLSTSSECLYSDEGGTIPYLDSTFRIASKTGKTRVMAEIATNYLNEGYVILLLKPYAQLDRPFQIPDNLSRSQVLIIADSLEKYLRRSAQQESTHNQSLDIKTFIHRLNDAIEKYEKLIGSRYVYFIGTVTDEANELMKLSERANRWNNIDLVRFGRTKTEDIEKLISTLAKMSGISIEQELKRKLAEKNDGEFQSLILAFRQ